MQCGIKPVVGPHMSDPALPPRIQRPVLYAVGRCQPDGIEAGDWGRLSRQPDTMRHKSR